MKMTSVAQLGGAIVLTGAVAILAVSLPSAPARAVTQNNCVTMGPSAGGFWRVTNGCSHTVIGKFCYENDRYNGCGQSPGGFGPLGSGRSEGVSSPTSQPAQWRVTYCNYDDFPGYCTIANP